MIIVLNIIIPIDIFWSNIGVWTEINSHHSIIGKYERDEVKPTIDVVKRLAEELGTTISYLMGETENKNAFKDPAMFKRILDIESLPEKDRECLLLTVVYFI